MLSGLAVVVLAVAAAVRHPASDAAWVAIPLGVLLVVGGVAFARMSGDDTDDDDDDDDADDDDDETSSAGFQSAPLAPLSWVIALFAGYVAARVVGRPVDSSLAAVGTISALWLANRAVDRWARRREARGGEPGPASD